MGVTVSGMGNDDMYKCEQIGGVLLSCIWIFVEFVFYLFKLSAEPSMYVYVFTKHIQSFSF